jgi:hypothetical protein
MEPLRPFYAQERKVLLMFRIKPQPTQLAWQAPAAAAFFVLAAIAVIAGSLLTTTWILNAQMHPTLYAVGLVSLILALPVAMLGAHCLDLMDQQEKGSDAR